MARLGITLSALTLVTMLAYPAEGLASDICMRLEARLAALDSNLAPSADEQRLRRQRATLEQANDAARRSGCLGGSLFRDLFEGGHCGRLLATVERERAGLDRLQARRGNDGERQRAELVRALAANNCGAQYEARQRPSRRHGLFARLFGGRGFPFGDRGWREGPYFDDFGTYRTLCVRTCDGYYFPISFATVASHFAADEQTCQAMCPGTEVALYVHHNPGEESEAMVSLAGEPYTALPAAFRYRKEYDAACACGRMATPMPGSAPALAMSPIPEDDPWGFIRSREPQPAVIGEAPVPEPRPAPGEDPETAENRAGSFRPARVAPRGEAVAGSAQQGEKTIRIVGPAHYYGQ